MASPKHLWSGEWERESGAVPDAGDPAVSTGAGPAPEAVPAGPSTGTRRLVGGVALLLLATVAAVLALTLGGRSEPAPTAFAPAGPPPPVAPQPPSGGVAPTFTVPTPTQTPTPTPTPTPTTPVPPGGGAQPGPGPTTATAAAPVVTGPVYEWLGMELSPSEYGVSVAGVRAASAADVAGVNPGDVIQSIGGRSVFSMAELRRAAAHLVRGRRFSLQVARGTTVLTLSAVAAAPPQRGS